MRILLLVSLACLIALASSSIHVHYKHPATYGHHPSNNGAYVPHLGPIIPFLWKELSPYQDISHSSAAKGGSITQEICGVLNGFYRTFSCLNEFLDYVRHGYAFKFYSNGPCPITHNNCGGLNQPICARNFLTIKTSSSPFAKEEEYDKSDSFLIPISVPSGSSPDPGTAFSLNTTPAASSLPASSSNNSLASSPSVSPSTPNVSPTTPSASAASSSTRSPSVSPSTPSASTSNPSASASTPAASPSTPVASPSTPAESPSTLAASTITPAASPSTPAVTPSTPSVPSASPFTSSNSPSTPAVSPSTPPPTISPSTPVASSSTPASSASNPDPSPSTPTVSPSVSTQFSSSSPSPVPSSETTPILQVDAASAFISAALSEVFGNGQANDASQAILSAFMNALGGFPSTDLATESKISFRNNIDNKYDIYAEGDVYNKPYKNNCNEPCKQPCDEPCKQPCKEPCKHSRNESCNEPFKTTE